MNGIEANGFCKNKCGKVRFSCRKVQSKQYSTVMLFIDGEIVDSFADNSGSCLRPGTAIIWESRC